MVKQIQETIPEEESNIVPLDDMTVPSNYWNAENTAQLDEFIVMKQDGVVAYEKESVFNEGTPEENRSTSTYLYLSRDGDVKSGKISAKSIKEVKVAFGISSWKQLEKKTLVATIKTFKGNSYIEWIPKVKKSKK